MPKKNENTQASQKIVKDDEYYNVRLSNTQEAIDQMDDGKVKNQMQYALDEVLTPVADTTESQRYNAYLYLRNLDTRHGVNSIKRIKTNDPNRMAYDNMVEGEVDNFLNGINDGTTFDPIRKTKNGEKHLTMKSLKEFIAGKYNIPYDKNTDYATTSTDETAQTEEVVQG
jgi:hypothetical protein|tara:strand:- start:20 stop:529 length:510 start_codon:yes stop_codon:yes gene_type:complete